MRARAYCACSRCGWGCLDIFTILYLFSPLSPSLCETVRYRLKLYCLKVPLNRKQPPNRSRPALLPLKLRLLSLLFWWENKTIALTRHCGDNIKVKIPYIFPAIPGSSPWVGGGTWLQMTSALAHRRQTRI